MLLRATTIPLTSKEFGHVEPGETFHASERTAQKLMRRGMAELHRPVPIFSIPETAPTYSVKDIKPKYRRGKPTNCPICNALCVSKRQAREHCE